MTQFEQVSEFNNDVLGIEIGSVICLPVKDVTDLTLHQLREEADELELACNSMDSVEAIDALIDSIYFAMGALYKIGLDEKVFNRIFTVIHTANMKKFIGKKEGREGYSSADAIKPIGWISPEEMIEEIVNDYNNMRT